MPDRKRSITRLTALALDRLLRNGDEYTAQDVRPAIERVGIAGASGQYIHLAARWLRDHGIPVATKKARHKSIWFEALTPAQMDEYGERVVQEAYSEIRANARSCKMLTGRGSRTARNRLIKCAIELGDYLGMDANEVVAECEPLHVVDAASN